MPLFLTSLFTLLTNGFALVAKHPIVLKMMFFSMFLAILHYAISKFFLFVTPYIVDSPVLVIAYKLGLVSALSLYITIVLAGFGMKQVISYIKS